MAEPNGCPIIILSEDDDDDDDDVVVVKEEKIPIVEDDDVVFISQTPATNTPQSKSQLLTSSTKKGLPQLPAASESFCQEAVGDSTSDGVGIKRNNSIATPLGQNLRLNSLDHCPLDLSNHFGYSKPDDSAVASLKNQLGNTAVEALSSVSGDSSVSDGSSVCVDSRLQVDSSGSVETEAASMVMDTAGSSSVIDNHVVSSSDVSASPVATGSSNISSYLGDSTLSSGVGTDSCLSSPDMCPVVSGLTTTAAEKTVTVKSSDFKSLVQSTRSGLLGGSMDVLTSIPSCLDSYGNTSVYSNTNGLGASKDSNSSSHGLQTDSLKDACDLLLNFTKCYSASNNFSVSNILSVSNSPTVSNSLPVNSSSSIMCNPSLNCDVTQISSSSVDSSGPNSLSFVSKSANLPSNNNDQMTTLHSHFTPCSTRQYVTTDSLQSLSSPQRDSLSRSMSLPVQTATSYSMFNTDPGQSTAAPQSPLSSFTVSTTNVVSSSRIAQCNLPPRKRVRVRAEGEDRCVKVAHCVTKALEVCVLCKLPLTDLKVSRCTQGHPACEVCLEGQVKLILTDKQGSLECIKDMCSSYYPMSELKHALPSLVVDILEEKLHKDYINFISDMMMTNVNPPSTSDGTSHTNMASDHSSLNLVSSTSITCTNNNRDCCTDQDFLDNNLSNLMDIANSPAPPDPEPEPKNNDLPPHWYPMDKKKNLLIIELQPESEEYVDIAIQFYKTMMFPTVADIVKICRVQNPILWKYYCLKKMEMIHENDCHEIDMRSLFHGTASSVIEAICRKGFDWRVCGKHGCVYGQGCYFAHAAAYSHQYTDKIKGISRSRFAHLQSQFNNLRSMMLQSKQSSYSSNQLILPKPSPSLIGPFTPRVPPPAHVKIPQSMSLSQFPSTNFGRHMYGSLFTSGSSVVNTNYSQSVNSQVPSTSSGYVSPAGFSSGQSSSNQSSKTFVNSLPCSSAGSSSPSCSTFAHSLESSSVPNRFGSSGTIPCTSEKHQSLSEQGDQNSKGERVISLSKLISAPTRKMFLANVLVGKYTGGNSSLRKPPPFYSNEPYGKCYDSCVDNIFDPKIVVIFDSNQAYPEYIVEYNYSGDS